jgi:hypothetical protein
MKTEQHFRQLADTLVARIVGDEWVATWWNSPNQAFGNRTPETQWQSGSDAVINYLMQHALSGGGN